MRKYLIKRLLLLIPTILGISFLVFSISWIVPGGPIEQKIQELRFQQTEKGGSALQNNGVNDSPITEEQLDYLKKLYGFDKPFLVAYFQWQIKALMFDFGSSYRFQEPVSSLIVERLPISIYYGLLTTLLTYLLSIPLGVFQALHQGKAVDFIATLLIFVGYAFPPFVLGLILIYFMGVEWDLFPISGFTSDNFWELSLVGKAQDLFMHSFLPLLCYLVGSFAYTTLLIKNSFLENYGSLYVRTAVAKGLAPRRIVFVHVLRNSFIPLAATFGQVIGLVFTGSFLIESIFNIDGLGLLGYQAVVSRDYPVVLGTLYLSALFYLAGNILSDICLAWVDPRIRFE